MRRKNDNFGTGHFAGEIQRDYAGFSALSGSDRAKQLGWANGCPVPGRLISARGTSEQTGAQVMQQRYGKVNFWFRRILDAVQEENPELFETMGNPQLRTNAIGPTYEVENIPLSYYRTMPPLCVLPNFASARIFAEQVDGSEKSRQADPADRVVTALIRTGLVAREVETPYDFAANFAEHMTGEGVPGDKALGLLLGTGWLGEHNDLAMMRRQRSAIERQAPALWSRYAELSEDACRGLKIVKC